MLITPVAGSTEVVAIDIQVDNLGGLLGGVPGDDLLVEGEVSLPSGFFSGVLLTGEVTAFGFRDSGGTTDDFEFKFTITGGQLARRLSGALCQRRRCRFS